MKCLEVKILIYIWDLQGFAERCMHKLREMNQWFWKTSVAIYYRREGKRNKFDKYVARDRFSVLDTPREIWGENRRWLNNLWYKPSGAEVQVQADTYIWESTILRCWYLAVNSYKIILGVSGYWSSTNEALLNSEESRPDVRKPKERGNQTQRNSTAQQIYEETESMRSQKLKEKKNGMRIILLDL